MSRYLSFAFQSQTNQIIEGIKISCPSDNNDTLNHFWQKIDNQQNNDKGHLLKVDDVFKLGRTIMRVKQVIPILLKIPTHLFIRSNSKNQPIMPISIDIVFSTPSNNIMKIKNLFFHQNQKPLIQKDILVKYVLLIKQKSLIL